MITLNPQTITGDTKRDAVFGEGVDAFFSLLNLVSNPEAAKKRLGEIYQAATEANETIRTANEAAESLKVARAEHAHRIQVERADHDRAITAERAVHNDTCGREMSNVRERLANAERLEAQAKADAATAAELKADLEQRLSKIKQAAA